MQHRVQKSNSIRPRHTVGNGIISRIEELMPEDRDCEVERSLYELNHQPDTFKFFLGADKLSASRGAPDFQPLLGPAPFDSDHAFHDPVGFVRLPEGAFTVIAAGETTILPSPVEP